MNKIYRENKFHLKLILVIFFIYFFYSYKVFHSSLVDFKVFYVAGKHAFFSPHLLYVDSPDRFLYPPTASIFFIPFGFLNEFVSQCLWYIVLLLFTLFLATQSVFLSISILLLTRYYLISFQHGQINILILVGMFIAVKNRLPAISHGLWALLTHIKVFPILIFVYYFLKKQWRNFLFTFLGLILWIGLCFLVWPITIAKNLWLQFPFYLADKGTPILSENQSLVAFLMRIFSGSNFELFTVSYTNWTIFPLPLIKIRILSASIGTLLSTVTWIKVYKIKKENPNEFFYVLHAIIFTFLFMSPLVWKEYFLFLTPVVAFLIEFIKNNQKKISYKIGFLLIFLASIISSPDFVGQKLSKITDAASIHLFISLFIWYLWIKSFNQKSE